MTLQAGTRLGPYEILSLLGAGGMGEVYRAKDPRLGRDVAVKVLPTSFSNDPGRLKRFEQEARAAGLLNHPNITGVYDIGQHDGAPYVVQELLEGETLRSRLAAGALSVRKAIGYAVQIARGLAAAHEKGIVHRDLKPENLFLTKDGRVKILDFGLAKLTHAEDGVELTNVPTASAGTEPGVVLGTLGYMSPEQVRGKPADPRSDIFSCGAVLYEMLSGNRAFQGDSAADAMLAILTKDPPELSVNNADVHPGLDRLVRHCLEKSPEERFHSAHDLAFDLEAMASISGSPAGTPTLQQEPPRRRYLRRGFAVAFLVIAAVGLGLLARPYVRPSAPPAFRRLTFQRGYVSSARFAPDGRAVVYSATWLEQPLALFSLQPDNPESRALGFPAASLLSISRSGELALRLGISTLTVPPQAGILARVPLSGGSPREVLDRVTFADWAPNSELAVVHSSGGRNRLEFPRGHVLYETAGWIGQMRLSPRGDLVAFIEHPLATDLPGRIMLVRSGAEARALTEEWLVIEGLAWSPKGDEVWFTGSNTGIRRSLWAVTLSGKTRLLESTPTALKLQDVSAAGGALLTSESWNASLVGVPPGEMVERDFSWLDFSQVMDLSEDGRTLLFEEWGEAVGTGVYIRHLDGSAPVRLGDGLGLGLSPDARWVLTMLFTSPPKLVLLPTGSGATKPIHTEGLSVDEWGRFLPDGKRIVFLAHEPGKGNQIYIEDLSEGKPRAGTPEGVSFITPSCGAVSPDGKFVVANDANGRTIACPLNGGEPQPVAGTAPGDRPLRWTVDGKELFVLHSEEGPVVRIFAVTPSSGKRELWKELRVADTVVGAANNSVVLSGDGKSYFWTRERLFSELFLLEGVR